MAIGTDFEIQADKDIRYIGAAHGANGAGYYTVIEFHRWLQDLADDASSVGTPIINKVLTNSSGIASNPTFELTGSSQPVTGRVRKSTSSPYYKTSPVSGSITSSGLDVTVFMIGDE